MGLGVNVLKLTMVEWGCGVKGLKRTGRMEGGMRGLKRTVIEWVVGWW